MTGSVTDSGVERFFLFAVFWAGFAAFAIFEVARAIGRAFDAPTARRTTAAALAIWILVPSGVRAANRVRTIVERQPLELVAAASYLDRVAPPEATVMARKPNIAYLSRRPWRELPDAGSLDELRAILSERPPDYLVFDRWGLRFARHLSALANPATDVEWLRRVYHDPAGGVTIYAVRPDPR